MASEPFEGISRPSEDEVNAAIYAHRSGSHGKIAPAFEDLPVFVRLGIYDDMETALWAAAMVRALSCHDASGQIVRPEGEG